MLTSRLTFTRRFGSHFGFHSGLHRTLHLGLIAMLMAVLTPQTLAQSDTGPAEECLARVAHIADRAAHANMQSANRTIEHIESLDAQGAPDRAIVATGRLGKAIIDRRVHASSTRIARVVNECVAFLEAHDAPRAAIIAVRRGGNQAAQVVVASGRIAKARINAAVATAVEG